jgi:hypothetical protein
VFVVWGTKTRREPWGAVADWCPACRAVRAFSVAKYFRVGHLYFIPLGRGSLRATVRECWECGAQYHCHTADYQQFVADEAAEQMSLAELVLQTNPWMEKRLRAQRQARPGLADPGADAVDVLPAEDDPPPP